MSVRASTEDIKVARKVLRDWCRDNELVVDTLAASDLVQKIAEALTLSRPHLSTPEK